MNMFKMSKKVLSYIALAFTLTVTACSPVVLSDYNSKSTSDFFEKSDFTFNSDKKTDTSKGKGASTEKSSTKNAVKSNNNSTSGSNTTNSPSKTPTTPEFDSSENDDKAGDDNDSDEDNQKIPETVPSKVITEAETKAFDTSVRTGDNDEKDSDNGITEEKDVIPVKQVTYSLENSFSSEGSSFWNKPTIKLSANLAGDNLSITAETVSGKNFSLVSNVYLKVGSYESYGVNHATDKAYTNRSSITLYDSLSKYDWTENKKSFYIRFEDSAGSWSWAGPIVVRRNSN